MVAAIMKVVTGTAYGRDPDARTSCDSDPPVWMRAGVVRSVQILVQGRVDSTTACQVMFYVIRAFLLLPELDYLS